MLIGNFLKNIKKEFRNHQFAGLSFNSEDCKKDYIYFANKGTKSDRSKFIDGAIKKGATIIISEKKFEGLKNKVLFGNHLTAYAAKKKFFGLIIFLYFLI